MPDRPLLTAIHSSVDPLPAVRSGRGKLLVNRMVFDRGMEARHTAVTISIDLGGKVGRVLSEIRWGARGR